MELFGAFQKPNNIRIRIRLKFSNRIYSYSYSVQNFKPNIFVFVFGEEKIEQYSNSLKGENITFGRHQTNLRLTGPIRVGGSTWGEGAGG